MKITFLMQPRQSGKTSKAIYEFLKAPHDTILVVPNTNIAKYIINLFGIKADRVLSSTSFVGKILTGVDYKFKKIVLDEYMFYCNRDEIYQLIKVLDLEEVIIFSTSDKKYNKRLVSYIRDNRYKMNINDLVYQYSRENKESTEVEFKEIYYNFLTDPNVNIIDRSLYRVLKNTEYMREVLGKEKYELEVLNQYLY